MRTTAAIQTAFARFSDRQYSNPIVSMLIRHRQTLRFLFVVCVTLTIYWMRAPDVFRHPQLWSEDGSVFFRGFWADGVLSFVTPYAGYLHVVPRTIVMIAGMFSAIHAPAIYAGLSVCVAVWSALTLSCCRTPHAILLSLTLLVVPGCHEIFGTITNVQWLMQPTLLVIVISGSPLTRLSALNQIVFSAFSCFSGPFSILALPLAIYRVRRDSGDMHGRIIAGIVVAGAFTQAFVLTVVGSRQPVTSYRPAALLKAIVTQAIEADPSHATGHIDSPALKFFLMAVLLIVAIRSSPKFIAQCLSYVSLSLLAVWLRCLRNGDTIFYGWGERYFYMPRLFLIWCIGVIALQSPRNVVLAVAALLVVFSGPLGWQRPALPILPWRSLASRIDDGQPVVIRINPSPVNIPVEQSWRLDLPARPARSQRDEDPF